tara:strand:- start:103 stop:489 length:387 start_codon:yes stop_codon:yes gene_type:complete
MLQGKHPQTGSNVQEWGCSIAWLPLLLVENSGQQVKTTASVESFRNEMVKANMVTLAMVEKQNREKDEKKEESGSIWSNIAQSQEAIRDDEPDSILESIQLLQGKKNDKKDKTKVNKNGNNNKQRNNK